MFLIAIALYYLRIWRINNLVIIFSW